MPPKPFPHYPLVKVHKAEVIRVMRGKARETVRQHFEALGVAMTDLQATRYVIAMLRRLTPGEFVMSQPQLFAPIKDLPADVYGVRDEAGDWYLKFYAYNGEFIVPSCHRPQWPLTRADGLCIGKREPAKKPEKKS